ncbi:MAG: glycosyltransferase family 4 protein [Victivallales bacterium]|nr:glycosyltransferase family 4 protein [Victivallales bacterium]
MSHEPSRKLGIILTSRTDSTGKLIFNRLSLLEKMGYHVRIYIVGKYPDGHPGENIFHGLRARVSYELPGFMAQLFKAALWLPYLAIRNPRGFFKAAFTAIKLLPVARCRFRLASAVLHAANISGKYSRREGINCFYSFASDDAAGIAMFAGMYCDVDFCFGASAADINVQSAQELLLKINVARFITVPSQHLKNHLRELGLFPTRVYALPLGVDLKHFRFPPMLKPPAEPYKLLTICDLTRDHGVDKIITACGLLRQQGIKVFYTIIGLGPDKDRLEMCIKNLKLEKSVRIVERADESIRLREYHNADIFIWNRHASDVMVPCDIPGTMIEAAASGLPVIAARNGAITELIEHEETGILFSPDSAEEIAAACKMLFDDEIIRELIIIKARLTVEGKFDMRKRVSDFIDICENNEILV